MNHAKVQSALTFLAPIRHLMEDGRVTEIMVNGANDVWVKRFGTRPEKTEITFPEERIRAAITMLASVSMREVGDESGARDKANVVSTGLPGFRFEAWMPPVAVRGPAFTARKLASDLIALETFLAADSDAGGARRSEPEPHAPITRSSELPALLRELVLTHRNIFLAGGTGAGKTTACNALLQMIPPHERLLVIETVHELIVSSPNHILLEADEEQGYSINRLLVSALRGLPDRIIIGEVRGAEAYGLLKAANTGHPGSIATLHANSALETLERLEDMVVEGRPELPIDAIRRRIANTRPFVLFIEQVERAGKFRPTLTQVLEVTGFQDGHYLHQPTYTFN